MALTWKPTRANILKQIRQINFVLANPKHRIAAIYLQIWTKKDLEKKRDELVQAYRQKMADRSISFAA